VGHGGKNDGFDPMKEAAMTDTKFDAAGAGVALLREKLQYLSRKSNLVRISKDLDLSNSDLEDFAHGRRKDLPRESLQLLAAELYNAALNDDGLLQPLNRQEPIPLTAGYSPTPPASSYPPPWKPAETSISGRAPRPVKAEKPKPRAARAGWAE
jgi:hypothetical protein